MHLGIANSAHAAINRLSMARCIFRFLELSEASLVNFTEYSRLIDLLFSLYETPEKETDLLFSMCDMDGDLRLNRDELKELLVLFYGKTPAMSTIDKIWNQVCIDRMHSSISPRSYVRWLSGQVVDTVPHRRSRCRAPEYVRPGMNPFEAYLVMKDHEVMKDTRPPWFPRHHIGRRSLTIY